MKMIEFIQIYYWIGLILIVVGFSQVPVLSVFVDHMPFVTQMMVSLPRRLTLTKRSGMQLSSLVLFSLSSLKYFSALTSHSYIRTPLYRI